MIDKIKHIFSKSIERIKHLQGIIGIIIMTLTYATIVLPHFEKWGFHPYLALPMIMLLIFIFIIVFSYIYIDVLKMHKFLYKANIELNPYSVNRIPPIAKLMNLTFNIPLLEKLGLNKEAKILRRWCNLEYISDKDDDVPKELKKLIKTFKDKEKK